MAAPTIRTTTARDEPSVIDTVVLAFSADPVARWSWPGSHQYLSSMPAFIRAFAGGAFAHSRAYCSDDYAGAALWLPPGVHSDDAALGEIIQNTISGAILDDFLAVFDQMAKYHPKEPHWYLPMIGVDPLHQGRGYGSAILSHALQHCDAEHMPAYLESTNPRNMTLYQRHGFKALVTIQVGASPPVVPMLREPR